MLHYRQPSVNFDSELTTLEPILSRRWPLLSSSERKKRWTMEDDNDEIIIPIDDTFIQQSISATRTDNNLTVTKNDSNELFSFNSTMAKEQSNMSSSETDSDENSTVASTINEIKYPLLRQDFTGINETNELKSMSINDDISQNSQTSIEQFYEDNENLTTINNIFSSTASNEILDNNSKELEISSINASDINQIILSEKNETINDTIGNLTISEIISSESDTSSIAILSDQTIEETPSSSQAESLVNEISTMTKFGFDRNDNFSDSSTIFPETTIDNQTFLNSETSIISEYNTTEIDEISDTAFAFNVVQNSTSYLEENINDTRSVLDAGQNGTILNDQIIDDTPMIWNTGENDTNIIEQNIENTTMTLDVAQNNTSSLIIDEDDEYSKETATSLPKTTTKPIRDVSCQCSKECLYGFEIIDNKCQCDPPCKNYACFGNDTCSVTSNGQPICQPENEDRPIRCYQPRDSGYHDVTIQYHNRWYYNPEQDTCHLFVYRGLGGNKNNFQTLRECHLECITCAPAPDPGTCLGHLPMWYYDYKQNQCSQFEYSGCKGNENKFLRKQKCIDTCVTRILNL